MRTVRDAFLASRPISWINTAAPFFVGYLIARQEFTLTLIWGTVYFLTAYNLLLYGVNDIFDYESDVKNPRKSGIEGALIAKERHLRLWIAIVLTNVLPIIYFLTIGTLTARLVFAGCIAMNLAYSVKGLRFKEIPFLDSFTSSTHFYSPLIYGLLIGGATWLPWPAIIAFVAWGMASHAFGAVQDIPYDRQAGIGSIATVLGLGLTIRVCVGLYVTSATIVAISYGWYGVIAGAGLLLYALNAGLYVGLSTDQAPVTNRGWRQFLWLNILVGYLLAQELLRTYHIFGRLTSVSDALIGLGIIALPVAAIYLVQVGRSVTRTVTLKA